MSTTLTPERRQELGNRIGSGAKRVGYAVAAALNAVFLWIAHQLLDWGWPGFLTEEFERLLPVVTVSFAVSIAANLWFVWDDTGWRKPFGQLVDAITGFVAAWRTWVVFPFDFSDGTDWSWLARTVVVVGIVGTAIGVLVYAAQLVTSFGWVRRPSGP